MTAPGHSFEAACSERICRVILRALDVPSAALPLSASTKLFGSGLGIDSIDVLQLVAALEREFEVTFEDSELDLARFESVRSITELLARKARAS